MYVNQLILHCLDSCFLSILFCLFYVLIYLSLYLSVYTCMTVVLAGLELTSILTLLMTVSIYSSTCLYLQDCGTGRSGINICNDLIWWYLTIIIYLVIKPNKIPKQSMKKLLRNRRKTALISIQFTFLMCCRKN